MPYSWDNELCYGHTEHTKHRASPCADSGTPLPCALFAHSGSMLGPALARLNQSTCTELQKTVSQYLVVPLAAPDFLAQNVALILTCMHMLCACAAQ